MCSLRAQARGAVWSFRVSSVLLLAVTLGGCQKMRHADMTPLDQAGMFGNSIDQLRRAQVTDVEVQQLALARQAGLNDDACVQLMRIAHNRQQPFMYGQAVADLAGAGFKQDSILTLARLNQLPWAGEAELMHLANLSDTIVLAVAQRRAAGEVVLSGDKVAALRNVGLSEKEILSYIEQGIADYQADQLIARRNYLAGHGFVHESGRRR